MKVVVAAAVQVRRKPVRARLTQQRPDHNRGFSDYQCPFCQRAEDSVKEVMKKYGNKVRPVYMDFRFHHSMLGAGRALRRRPGQVLGISGHCCRPVQARRGRA